MAITGTQVMNRARTVLNDSAGTRWNATEACLWLTDCEIEIVTFKPNAYTKFATHTLTNDSRQLLAFPDANMLLDVVRNTGGAAITVCARDTLDTTVPNWHNVTGTAVENYCFDIREPNVFWSYPVVDGGQVDVMYSAFPPEITAEGQTLSIGNMYLAAATAYVLYRCYAKEDEVAAAQKAAAYYQMFTQILMGKASVEKGDSPNLQFIPFNPQIPGAAR